MEHPLKNLLDKKKEQENKPKPKIVCAALRINNIIIIGVRHFDKIMKDQIHLHNLTVHIEPAEEGFIDQFGNFLTRIEAFKVARDSGQPIDFVRNGSTTELYSEGLY